MFILVFWALFAYGAYNLWGAVAFMWTTLPLILVLPLVAWDDFQRWRKNRHRWERDAKRHARWRAEVKQLIEEHKERYPEEDDVDEKGIPYDF